MIGRKPPAMTDVEIVAPQSFDDFDLRLGDMMRGERATMGKSLLDVQRELRIKASYIAAIENCDPSAFDTPGFIAGYVRSYARYLGMDPDETFAHFCAESGFAVAHGMSERASTIRRASDEDSVTRPAARDPFADPKLPFSAADESFLSRIEPAAIGSTFVLIALVAGIGYGGWSVLQEVQRVQVSPVDQTPVVLSELDPLDAAQSTPPDDAQAGEAAGVFTPPSQRAFDRLYRPQALDVPVLVARDAPISTLDPSAVGVFADATPRVQSPHPAAAPSPDTGLALATSDTVDASGVVIVAARPAWVKLEDGAGSVVFSGILNAGDTLPVPSDAPAPAIDIGESGAIYFALDGVPYGPAGPRGQVSSDVLLMPDLVAERYETVVAGSDPALDPLIAKLAPAPRATPAEEFDPVAAAIAAATRASSNAPLPSRLDTATGPVMPKVLADSAPGVTIVASREAWVRVRAPSGATLFETVMQPGDSYNVPQTEQPPTIRTGDAGAVYFAVNGVTFGPYGANGAVKDNLALSPDVVSQELAVADLSQNATLARIVAALSLGAAPSQ